ncbi:hypothetical protein ACPOLB_03920 [Rubrivivax sp. RP6-9]|uniref:hypothetical protein n=1 Tax=Rubrivivax sp. RP6-9 TaxID=3415750 RepID=UPI003CC6A658
MSPTKLILITASSLLLMTAAHAQTIRISVPDEVPIPASTVSRAEVLAQLHMWRLSGLADLHRGEGSPDSYSLEYRKAEAKYAWLVASPQYPMLVAELSRRPHATVLAQRRGANGQGLSFVKD